MISSDDAITSVTITTLTLRLADRFALEAPTRTAAAAAAKSYVGKTERPSTAMLPLLLSMEVMFSTATSSGVEL